MTFPTFSSGEVLRAQDMNAVGLWLVKTQTVGSGVSSVTVTGAFSTEYDNYLINVSGGTASGNTTLSFRCGTQASGYRYSYLYTSLTSSPQAVGTTTGTQVEYVGFVNTTGTNAQIGVSGPWLSGPTMVTGDGGSIGNFAGRVTGLEPSNASFTSFTILPTTGTFTGCTIAVYGYKK
jgi:hypothetical protein